MPRALRYVTRFACLADRCEDTCCAGLRVPIDARGFGRLRELFHAEPQRLRDAVVLDEQPAGPDAVAFFRMREDGGCPFLSAERLCALHRDHGEQLLPDICATFPRAAARVPDGLEVTASFACPEAARLALLADDGLDWVEAPPDLVTRPPGVDVAPEAIELRRRDAAMRLMRHEAVPLGTRVVVLLHLAAEADPPRFDDFASDEVTSTIHHNFAPLALPGGKVAALLLRALNERLQAPHPERFAALVRGVHGELDRAGASTPESAFAAYVAAREAVDIKSGGRVQQLLTRYALYQLARHFAHEPGSAIAAAARLSLRLCLMRFVLALHASATGLARGTPDPAEVDRSVVDVLQQCSKHLEHHPSFKDALDAALDCSDTERFARALLFAKFL